MVYVQFHNRACMTAIAADIAGINALGNLSGFAGPYMMGYLKDGTGNFTAGLLVLGGCALLGSIVALMLKVNRHMEIAGAESGNAAAGPALAR
jgi:ACS family tartrate transporter-like MFS transporter